MKTFRHIQLYGSHAQIAAFHEKLAEWVPTAAWRRNVDLRGSVAPDVSVFEYTGGEAPGACVWLFDEPYGARVTNIVPRSAGALSHDEYNTIAMGFAHDVLNPIATQLSVRIEVGPSEKSIEDLLPASVASALRQFSSSTNRSTGTAHPQDAEKWDKFVILAHRERVSMAPDTLRHLLVEDEHWDHDQALDLALKYESAQRLLESYRNFKAA
jgi:hypothetical protein